MSLHIIIGLDSPKADAATCLVYAGRSGTDARAAMEAATAEYFLVLHNPTCIRKHNTRGAANRAALDPQAIAAAAEAKELARLLQEKQAAAIQEEARARAKAKLKSGAIADLAVGVVQDAIAKAVAEDAAEEEKEESAAAEPPGAETETEPDDPSAHFGKRKKK